MIETVETTHKLNHLCIHDASSMSTLHIINEHWYKKCTLSVVYHTGPYLCVNWWVVSIE